MWRHVEGWGGWPHHRSVYGSLGRWPWFLLLNYGKFILFIEGVASNPIRESAVLGERAFTIQRQQQQQCHPAPIGWSETWKQGWRRRKARFLVCKKQKKFRDKRFLADFNSTQTVNLSLIRGQPASDLISYTLCSSWATLKFIFRRVIHWFSIPSLRLTTAGPTERHSCQSWLHTCF